MRIGSLISIPDEYTHFATIQDMTDGSVFTVHPSIIPEDLDPDIDDEFAYRVDVWENGSGLIVDLDNDI